jgi:hypothetical protein
MVRHLERKDSASRKGVKQLKSGLELLGPTGLEILEKLGAGSTAAETARVLGCSKPNVTYWKDRLVAMGALRLQVADVIKYYSLTPYGLKILARSEEQVSESVVLEDHAVKFAVVEHEKCRIDWRKLGEPRNWEQLGAKVCGVKVEKTSRHVIIHPGRLRGFDVDELEVEAGRIVERIRLILEAKFGMVLADDGVPIHKPIFRFYSDEAKEDVKNGTCIVEGVGSVDCSPPERVPHEEYCGKERAKARLLLPDKVRRMEIKLDGLIVTVERLVDLTAKLVDSMTQVVGVSEGSAREFKKSDFQSYVR